MLGYFAERLLRANGAAASSTDNATVVEAPIVDIAWWW